MNTKKDEKSKVTKKDEKSKVAKARQEMTVKVIRHNKYFDKLTKDMREALLVALENEKQFSGQRELCTRTKMLQRILSSGIKLINQNKLHFYMISEDDLQIGE